MDVYDVYIVILIGICTIYIDTYTGALLFTIFVLTMLDDGNTQAGSKKGVSSQQNFYRSPQDWKRFGGCVVDLRRCGIRCEFVNPELST